MVIFTPKTKKDLENLVVNPDINLVEIDVTNITDMSFLFKDSKRENFDGIEEWNVSNVIDMKEIFYGCQNFNQDISLWDVSKVKDMTNAFAFTNFNQDLSSWKLDSIEKIVNADPFLGNSSMKQDFKPYPFNKAGFSNNNINKL